jgi:hypothetical protein
MKPTRRVLIKSPVLSPRAGSLEFATRDARLRAACCSSMVRWVQGLLVPGTDGTEGAGGTVVVFATGSGLGLEL